ncbi:hypothetical protein ABPG75_000714 [Micractinium tetrahymenae]
MPHPEGQGKPCWSGQAPTLGDRLFAWFMSQCGPKVTWRLKGRKQALFERLHRDHGIKTVVEVGMGTAPNLEFYGPFVDKVIGIDPNTAMAAYALRAAEAAGVASKLRLLTGRAQALPLDDASADAVVMTHVLCTVKDQAAALVEARRVLRPGGLFIFLEHVAADPGDRLARWQRWLDPAVGVVGHGCSATRHTLEAIQAAGFSAVQAERFRLDLWLPAAVVAPHVAGVAVR